MKSKYPVVLPRLLAMATVAGTLTMSGAPAQVAPVSFASNIEAKLAPLAASLAGAVPDADERAQVAFVELVFVRFYSRIKPPGENPFDAAATQPGERPSAVDIFREVSSLA